MDIELAMVRRLKWSPIQQCGGDKLVKGSMWFCLLFVSRTYARTAVVLATGGHHHTSLFLPNCSLYVSFMWSVSPIVVSISDICITSCILQCWSWHKQQFIAPLVYDFSSKSPFTYQNMPFRHLMIHGLCTNSSHQNQHWHITWCQQDWLHMQQHQSVLPNRKTGKRRKHTRCQ